MRRRIILPLTAVVLGAVAVAAQAQEAGRLRPTRTPRSFTYIIEGDSGTITLSDSRRGRIGITVSLTPDRSRDSIGAWVQAVNTGGPADRAGMRAGDLIVRWNDVRLAEGETRSDEDVFRSRPGQRLINMAQRLEPGDTVRLDVRRENRAMQFTVVADSADLDRIVARMPSVMLRGEGLPLIEGMAPSRMRVMAYGGYGGLELVRVNPQMAENLNLGVSEGLLVVNIDTASTLGLRAGDVLLTIGGRRASSPEQAMRILSTYEAEEPVQFEVQRQRRRQTVSGRLPEARGRWRVTPNGFFPGHLEPVLRHKQNIESMMRRFREQQEPLMIEGQRLPSRSVRT